jgi:hypothetical protein
MDSLSLIKRRFEVLSGFVDERMRRLMVAAEAEVIGYGGVALVSRATGVSRQSISAGVAELRNISDRGPVLPGRIRKPGGGRKRAVVKDPTLLGDLDRLVEPVTRGDPESPLRWTCKSVRRLAAELAKMGHTTSHRMVAELLKELGYSLQANQKVLEGSAHPDRNAQFEHINATAREFLATGAPVISVDTKKKELIGPFKNGGRELRPKGDPEKVRVHDFIIPELGRANPYGVYDLANNAGWVSVGTDHDTASFAVESIRRWWLSMGQERHPGASRLLITADGGGSNGYRVRLWKTELQKMANELGFPITVCHFPPGTSKWNRIEHRLFSFITLNWRGKPLISHEVMVKLIETTTTTAGLKVRCQLDTNLYPPGIKVADKDVAKVRIKRHEFHGEWNYTILPSTQPELSNVIS